jgi:hypothetical protein
MLPVIEAVVPCPKLSVAGSRQKMRTGKSQRAAVDFIMGKFVYEPGVGGNAALPKNLVKWQDTAHGLGRQNEPYQTLPVYEMAYLFSNPNY